MKPNSQILSSGSVSGFSKARMTKKKKSQSSYSTTVVSILLTKMMKIWLLDLGAKVMLLVTSLFKVVKGANVSFLSLHKVKKKKPRS